MRADPPPGLRDPEPPHPGGDAITPVGSLTGGLVERLRRVGTHATVARATATPAGQRQGASTAGERVDAAGGTMTVAATDAPSRHRRDAGEADPRVDTATGAVAGLGTGTDAVTFAATVERAAAGLSRRGTCPDDVVGVLAPVSPERLTAVYTVMAVGGFALPLELTSDLETLIEVLTTADVRLILVSAPLAGIALELADRSRVRQIIAFGDAPETTPFEELLLPSPDGSGYDPTHGLFDNGILGYHRVGGGVRTVTHGRGALLARFSRLADELRLTPADTVGVDPSMSEPERSVLAALALWHGASVITTATATDAEAHAALAAAGATVSGSPAPARLTTPH